MAKLKPVTPGELLLEEFLLPMGLSQYRLAKEIGWLRAQAAYDTEVAEKALAKELEKIKPWAGTPA